jgi:hemerythrin-like domain-containing protein
LLDLDQNGSRRSGKISVSLGNAHLRASPLFPSYFFDLDQCCNAPPRKDYFLGVDAGACLHWDVAMSSVIETLREEHKNIAWLLNAMEDQNERLATASNPDFDLLQSFANYFCDYPDRCHHPKENAILRRLQAKHRAEAATVADLAKEHMEAFARARRFRDNIQAIFCDRILPRDKLFSAGRSFIDAEREHMRMEENLFFPLAASVLDEEDWRSIEGNIRQMQDPLFGELVEEEFRTLREFLLSWERENRRI